MESFRLLSRAPNERVVHRRGVGTLAAIAYNEMRDYYDDVTKARPPHEHKRPGPKYRAGAPTILPQILSEGVVIDAVDKI